MTEVLHAAGGLVLSLAIGAVLGLVLGLGYVAAMELRWWWRERRGWRP